MQVFTEMGTFLTIIALALAWAVVTQGPRLAATLILVSLSSLTHAQVARVHQRLTERGRAPAPSDPWAASPAQERRLLRSSLRLAMLRTRLTSLAPELARWGTAEVRAAA